MLNTAVRNTKYNIQMDARNSDFLYNMNSQDKLGAVFCPSFYSQGLFVRIIGWLVVVSSMMLNLWSIYTIIKKRNVVPIRQRAPFLVIYHTFMYLFIILIPLFGDIAFDWDTEIRSIDDIEVSRRIVKGLTAYCRVSLGGLLAFRFGVIWFQWKGIQMRWRNRFWKLLLKIMTDQKRVLVFAVVYCLIVFCAFYGDGRFFILYKPNLDWYFKELKGRVMFTNITILRVLELMTGLGALITVRTFPKDLRITEEYFVLLLIGIIFGWLYEVQPRLENKEDNGWTCLPVLYLRVEGLIDISRSLVFSLILSYYTRYKKQNHVPYNRIFFLEEFSKDLYCQIYFRKYLKSLNRGMEVVYTEELIRYGQEEEFSYSDELIRHFNKFKQTKSFAHLSHSRLECDIVDAMGIDR